MSKKIDSPATMLRDGSMFIYGSEKQPGMKDYDAKRMIGMQLAEINRFAGANTRRLDVAAHSLLACEIAEKWYAADGHEAIARIWGQLAALLHDAREIVLGDQPGPYLRYLRGLPESTAEVYEDEGMRFEGLVLSKLGLRPDLIQMFQNIVAIADHEALLMEAQFMPQSKFYKFADPMSSVHEIDVNKYFMMTALGESAEAFNNKLAGLLEDLEYEKRGESRVRPAVEKPKAHYLTLANMSMLNRIAAEVSRAYKDHDNFGIYLVGSCIRTPNFRDVDLRMIMKDEAFEALFPEDPQWHTRPLFQLTCRSISEWMERATGLQIDFQFQKQSIANSKHKGYRHALGWDNFTGDAAS